MNPYHVRYDIAGGIKNVFNDNPDIRYMIRTYVWDEFFRLRRNSPTFEGIEFLEDTNRGICEEI